MRQTRFLHATLLAAGAALTLGACTEQQTCEARVHNLMADIKAQIAESEDNLERGYAYIRHDGHVTFHGRFCTFGNGVFFLCAGPDFPTYKRVKIDEAAERAKLGALRARLPKLEAELARCASAYPGG